MLKYRNWEELAAEIALGSSFQESVVDGQEFKDEFFGVPLPVETQAQFNELIHDILCCKQNELVVGCALDGPVHAASILYHPDTNIMVLFSSREQMEPMVFRIGEDFREVIAIEIEDESVFQEKFRLHNGQRIFSPQFSQIVLETDRQIAQRAEHGQIKSENLGGELNDVERRYSEAIFALRQADRLQLGIETTRAVQVRNEQNQRTHDVDAERERMRKAMEDSDREFADRRFKLDR